MKLPLEFGTKFVFRLIIPGGVLAAAMAPFVHWVMHASGLWMKIEYLFPFEVIAWGWIIVICDMHIYMLFEGRRYWPRWLREWMVGREDKRLKKLEALMAKYRTPPPADPKAKRPISQMECRRRYLEASVQYGQFPMDEEGNVSAPHPTRLGNIIASFEDYPLAAYGFDAVFYWYRLWVVLDKDLREEIDNAQSLVDSTVYMTIVFYLSGIAILSYSAIGTAGSAGWPVVSDVHLPYVPGPSTLFVLGVACIVIGRIIYLLSFHTHAQFGELFKSLFDQYRNKLYFDDVVRTVGDISHSPYIFLKSQREKNVIVWRYLRWRRIRDDSTKQNKPVKDWL